MKGFNSFGKKERASGGLPVAESIEGMARGFWRGLTFWAKFDDVDNPLALRRGTGALSFTRATDASFLNPDTGLIEMVGSGNLRIEAEGALIEGQRTNLLSNSEALGSWVSYRTSIVSNAIAAPDGAMTADQIVENDTNHSRGIYQVVGVGESGGVYTSSIFVKEGTRNWVQLTNGNQGGYFNLSTGEWGNTSSGYVCSSKAYPNGWYRLSVSGVVSVIYPATQLNMAVVNGSASYQGDGESYVYAWGGQLEAGAFPSSYIPTTTAAVTRNADYLTMPSAGNMDGTVGTLSARARVGALYGDKYVLHTGSGNGFIRLGSTYSFAFYDGTNYPHSATSSWGDLNSHNVAAAWSGVTSKMLVDGGAITGSNFDGDIGLASDMRIGTDNTTDYQLFGHIKNLRIWNRALSDSDLQLITT